MFTATYRAYSNSARIVLEIWEGPGQWDYKTEWAYPLNKEQHALALMLNIVDARQMALAALDVIQTWQTVRLLKEWGVITMPTESEPQQLTLLDTLG